MDQQLERTAQYSLKNSAARVVPPTKQLSLTYRTEKLYLLMKDYSPDDVFNCEETII